MKLSKFCINAYTTIEMAAIFHSTDPSKQNHVPWRFSDNENNQYELNLWLNPRLGHLFNLVCSMHIEQYRLRPEHISTYLRKWARFYVSNCQFNDQYKGEIIMIHCKQSMRQSCGVSVCMCVCVRLWRIL